MTESATAASARPRNRRGSGDLLREQILLAVEEMAGDDYKLPRLAQSLREIARRVGVAAPSIYRHFATKEEVVLAALEAGYTELFTAEQDAAHDCTDPFDRLKAMGLAYCRYLIGRPGLTRLMFAANPMRWDADDDTPDYLGRQLETWTAAVSECATAGYRVQLPSGTSAIHIWSLLQGFVTLTLISRNDPADKADLLVEQVDMAFEQIRRTWTAE